MWVMLWAPIATALAAIQVTAIILVGRVVVDVVRPLAVVGTHMTDAQASLTIWEAMVLPSVVPVAVIIMKTTIPNPLKYI